MNLHCPKCKTSYWSNSKATMCPACRYTFTGLTALKTKNSKSSVIRYVNLECVDPSKNHDKFFDIFVMADNSVITVNGRNGTTGTVRPYKFGSSYQADNWAADKEIEKKAKGYILTRGQRRSSPPGYNMQTPKKVDFDPQDTSDPLLAQVIFDILQNVDLKQLSKSKKVSKVKEDLASLGMNEEQAKVEEIVAKIVSKEKSLA